MTISASTTKRVEIGPGDENHAFARADAHRPRRTLASRGRSFVPGARMKRCRAGGSRQDDDPVRLARGSASLARRLQKFSRPKSWRTPKRFASPPTARAIAQPGCCLRHTLSKAVGNEIAPAEWRYRDGPNGKPMLAAGFPAIEFNISHSDGCVAVAVSKDGPVGIDLECVASDLRSEIVEDVLTAAERDGLLQLSAEEKWRRFMRIWTAKEACAKALGLGLGLDFRRMEVAFDPLRVRMLGDLGPARFEVAMRDLFAERPALLPGGGASDRRLLVSVGIVCGSAHRNAFGASWRNSPEMAVS